MSSNPHALGLCQDCRQKVSTRVAEARSEAAALKCVQLLLSLRPLVVKFACATTQAILFACAEPVVQMIVQQMTHISACRTRAEFEGWGRGLAEEHGYTVKFWGAGQATHEARALAALGLQPPGFASQVHIITHLPFHIILPVVAVTCCSICGLLIAVIGLNIQDAFEGMAYTDCRQGAMQTLCSHCTLFRAGRCRAFQMLQDESLTNMHQQVSVQ